MKKILFALTFALTAIAAAPAAQATPDSGSVWIANDMSCQQARNYYARNGRIWVRTGNNVVPIWGLSQSCPAYWTRSAYWIRTIDDSSCVIGYRCYDDRGDH